MLLAGHPRRGTASRTRGHVPLIGDVTGDNQKNLPKGGCPTLVFPVLGVGGRPQEGGYAPCATLGICFDYILMILNLVHT